MMRLPVGGDISTSLPGLGSTITLATRNLRLAPPANKINRGKRLNLTLRRPDGKSVLLDVLSCWLSEGRVMCRWREFERGVRQLKRDAVKDLYALGFSVEQAYGMLYDPDLPGVRPLGSAVSSRALSVGVTAFEPRSREIIIFTRGDDGRARFVDRVGLSCVTPFAHSYAPFAYAWWDQYRRGHGDLTADAVRRVFEALGLDPHIVDYATGTL